MDAQKLEQVLAACAAPRNEAIAIIDPEFVYWSQRGDCGREEHESFLGSASVTEIASWVDGIYREQLTDAAAKAANSVNPRESQGEE